MERKQQSRQAAELCEEEEANRERKLPFRSQVSKQAGWTGRVTGDCTSVSSQVTFWVRTQKASKLGTRQATLVQERLLGPPVPESIREDPLSPFNNMSSDVLCFHWLPSCCFSLGRKNLLTMEETALYIKRCFQPLTQPLATFHDVCVGYVVIHMSKGSLWT